MSYLHVAATMLRLHEGYRDTVYTCPAGKRTIGYGHNIDANGLPPAIADRLKAEGRITRADAEALLDAGIQRAEVDCRRLFPRFEGFSDARKAALIDWLFNVGRGTAQKFTDTIHFINTGQWDRAADELMDSKYYRQLGGDPKGTDDRKNERPETIIKMIREG